MVASVVIFLLDTYANGHGQRWGDWLATAFFGAYGLYCMQNFFGCREVHCAVTGPGFLIAGILMALRAAGIYGSDSIPWIVFAFAALIGHGFERAYESRAGSAYMHKK
ncbi:MAG: hypothetical protein ACREM2_09950 [Vulcanimicrobiaceae bacterium]